MSECHDCSFWNNENPKLRHTTMVSNIANILHIITSPHLKNAYGINESSVEELKLHTNRRSSFVYTSECFRSTTGEATIPCLSIPGIHNINL
jgi:hypothetical protein